MPIINATLDHWNQIERFLNRAKYLYADTGREDLRGLIRGHVAVAGIDDAAMWGLLILQVESRPDTLPREAPDRAYLRFVALSDGRSPAVDVGALYAQARHRLTQRSGRIQVQVYGRERWVVGPLEMVGFTIVERIEFLRLENLQQRFLPLPQASNSMRTRPAATHDLALMSQLDALAFPPRWHFGEKDLLTLFIGGRVHVAIIDDQIVGYWALSLAPQGDAHLSRLAVHPDFHGRGVGRLLLADALAFARREDFHAVMLNTQTDNHRALSLYRSVGFRSTGRIVPILTCCSP